MADAIGETLGYAVGIAISPIPVAAVILMLFSGRARSNSVAFLTAWIVGIAVVATAVLLVPGLEADTGDPSTASGWFKLGLGVLLLVVAVRQWRARPAASDTATAPAWMARIDDLGVPAAFGLGVALSALNPKNLLLAAAAGATIGAQGLSTADTVVVVAVFTLVAAVTVAVPVAAYLVAGDRLDDTLDATKAWLIDNNAAVMAVLLVVFGVNLLGDALSILV